MTNKINLILIPVVLFTLFSLVYLKNDPPPVPPIDNEDIETLSIVYFYDPEYYLSPPEPLANWSYYIGAGVGNADILDDFTTEKSVEDFLNVRYEENTSRRLNFSLDFYGVYTVTGDDWMGYSPDHRFSHIWKIFSNIDYASAYNASLSNYTMFLICADMGDHGGMAHPSFRYGFLNPYFIPNEDYLQRGVFWRTFLNVFSHELLHLYRAVDHYVPPQPPGASEECIFGGSGNYLLICDYCVGKIDWRGYPKPSWERLIR